MVQYKTGRPILDGSRWLGVIGAARQLGTAHPGFDFERYAFAVQDPRDNIPLDVFFARQPWTTRVHLAPSGHRFAVVPFEYLESCNRLMLEDFGHRPPRRGRPSAWLRIPGDSVSLELGNMTLVTAGRPAPWPLGGPLH